MRPILEKLDALEMGGHRRDLAIAEEYAKRMLALTGNSDAPDIVQKIVWQYPSHDFYIDPHEAMAMGLPVEILDEKQDLELAGLITRLENGDSHEGFASELKKIDEDGLREAEPRQPRRNEKRKGNGSEEVGQSPSSRAEKA